ncbi:hypothetical protein LRS74_07140 [Streptomyces sp. LX-29]|uniref:hypothetical protein n=1 Tax=Streptomyces sp. LX-29 TaxID=2900152 RepID=UPI00240CE6B7|nr:hypothetical protein [Streptomyces sp. LX-29]WFB06841.1 hypothetical protein LRS74_07140 [Streptomyces sp. LX-29]
MVTLRQLPPDEDGRTGIVITDNPDGLLSRMADEFDSAAEDESVFMCSQLLGHARHLLKQPKVTVEELRFLAERLVEGLLMAINVAESRDSRSAPITPMPMIGDPVMDTVTGKVGLMMGWEGPQRARVTLYPPNGKGTPWGTAGFRQPTKEEWPVEDPPRPTPALRPTPSDYPRSAPMSARPLEQWTVEEGQKGRRGGMNSGALPASIFGP